jgi:hypothetical protein
MNKSIDQLEKLAEQNNLSNEKLDEQREKLIEMTAFNIRSNLITTNEIESMQALGMELVKHMQAIHQEELRRIAELQVHFNGFNAMKYFETRDEDSLFEKEKEKMREKLLEEVMMFAPEDDEEDFEDDDDSGDLFEDEDEDDEEVEDEITAKS